MKIQNFSLSVEKYFMSECSEQVKYICISEIFEEFFISKSKWPCNLFII